MIDERYVDRYLKVVDDRCIQHFGVKNGDFLKYAYTNEIQHQHWGDVTNKQYYWGSSAHAMKYFDLMPPGYKPPLGARVLVDSPIKPLDRFPSEGVCWQPTQELRDFLSKKYGQYSSNSDSKGVAWSNVSFWTVQEASGKPVYNIKQLEPFIKITYYDKYNDEIKVGDHFIVDSIKNDAHGVRGIVGKFFEEGGKTKVELQRPLPRHPGGGDLLAVPLDKVKVISPPLSILENPVAPEDCYSSPDKWCIKTTVENRKAINDFMVERNSEFNGYNSSWKALIPVGYFFHYPQQTAGTRAHDKIKPGYIEITFDQFKAYVLTHTESTITYTEKTKEDYLTFKTEEDGRSNQPNTGVTIKVQRSDLSIRGREPARGVGIKCDHIQIKVGSGHLPD